MPTAVELELNDYQKAYSEMIVNPHPKLMRPYLQQFFSNFPEDKPEFMDWVSYGLLWDPSPEFVDHYQDYLNWQILSRYQDFGIIGIRVDKECRDNFILKFADDDALHNHGDKINVWFAIISFYIMTTYVKDDRWVREHVGLSPIYNGRNLLRTDVGEFTESDHIFMHLFSKKAIRDGYEFLERQLQMGGCNPSGDPTDMNMWAQCAREFVRSPRHLLKE